MVITEISLSDDARDAPLQDLCVGCMVYMYEHECYSLEFTR